MPSGQLPAFQAYANATPLRVWRLTPRGSLLTTAFQPATTLLDTSGPSPDSSQPTTDATRLQESAAGLLSSRNITSRFKKEFTLGGLGQGLALPSLRNSRVGGGDALSVSVAGGLASLARRDEYSLPHLVSRVDKTPQSEKWLQPVLELLLDKVGSSCTGSTHKC